jgi:hypothetical protein
MSDWLSFIKEGDESYNYMLHHYHQMIDHEILDSGFIVYYATYVMYWEYDKIHWDRYDIQRELITWIHNEYERRALFERNNWKYERDSYSIVNMYIAYRKLFVYHNYYFQLIIEGGKYGKQENDPIEYYPVFQLALFGWKGNIDLNVEPYHNSIVLLPDHLLPDTIWNYHEYLG